MCYNNYCVIIIILYNYLLISFFIFWWIKISPRQYFLYCKKMMRCLIYNVLFNKRLRFLEFKYNVSGSHKACLISTLLDDAFRSERAWRVRAERKERWDAIKQARTRSMKRVSRSNELLDPCYGNLRRHQPTLVH